MEQWALVGLGAWHGINPGMGWLFAVALAMQEGSGRAAGRALLPLGIGHAGAVVAAVGVAAALGSLWDETQVARVAGFVLIGFGLYKLRVRRHPRYGGMRASLGDLTIWSFLMASAHGAGLMVVPFALSSGATGPGSVANHSGHLAGMSGLAWSSPVSAAAIHTGTYLATVGLVAWIVYSWAGVGFLRRWWLNGDLVWAAVLMLTGSIAALR